MDFKGKLQSLKREFKDDNAIRINIPETFSFKNQGAYDFESFVSFFDWTIENRRVYINLQNCFSANYQALSTLVLYAWKLKSQGCTVTFIESESLQGASEMFRTLGARGAFTVLMHENVNFKGSQNKPLFAIRNNKDFKKLIETAESYTQEINLEFTKTLRYILSELLYNTIEHGYSYYQFGSRQYQVPSLCQFSWYRNKGEVSFLIADSGMGIKNHLEQTYPGFESHADAILAALRPQVSGAFKNTDPYKDKNNAGIGLFLSSNIVRRLKAEMHVISGDGVVHITPRDTTITTMDSFWPGTMVLVNIKADSDDQAQSLEQMLRKFREDALSEQRKADVNEGKSQYYVEIRNFFGAFAEDKQAAIAFKNERLFPALEMNKQLLMDFKDVESAPHSFLSALLASPVKSLGMRAYKTIKIVNANADIRETIDFILDENTE